MGGFFAPVQIMREKYYLRVYIENIRLWEKKIRPTSKLVATLKKSN
jgi:hypothetical protein